ncbi:MULTISPECIES: MFS transporter [Geobacillus]|jgi:MFS family permease|uniref:Transporter, MFS superfamily n=3 Tax=Geobacillus thermodenitrificans TaxID=33940 RepID=A4IKC2_GEOTN|nr:MULTISPECIES: MFS transporter [Geobacillus]ABO65776.1 Transporter, MFS superfamily [Geobacillus thermodenitrificans NG80-2]ARA97775.1 MFS transporter [Geobacillus thermodenitrificans]ARP41468.1 putative MFS-type transporter [Geobacillus thermodenitrificans]ATO37120.1 MFS transporter [Geobacillus thermodenitrificans]KQB94666.1 putative MFS-type transporter YfkF [Geobacillus sp. PA-3]
MRFAILTGIVAISGLSQGMLLPLLAMLLDESGVSSTVNGAHAAALYIGVLAISPFLEHPLGKYGYKPMIIMGGFIVICSLILFPLFSSFFLWLVIRFFIGMGDHMLHFATQTWITDFSPPAERGRRLSLYGLAFGLGFTAGPLLASLASINEALPFYLAALLSFIGWIAVFCLPNEKPKAFERSSSAAGRWIGAWKYAWPALLLPLAYGFLEAAIHSVFPLYALHKRMSAEQITLILPFFSFGGIIFQLPLGALSDRFGRRVAITGALLAGISCFLTALVVDTSTVGLATCLFAAGMFTGSLFSLGIAYMTDLLPKTLLPAGNLLSGMLYSLGSIIGPPLAGSAVDVTADAFFLAVSAVLLIPAVCLARRREREKAA